MKPKNAVVAGVCALLLLANFDAAANKIDFTNNLKAAKERAALEGKLVVIDFVASWCMPCRWMDESTYSHPDVIEYMERNTVPVKIDIDDFDGYALKDQFNVKVLPTIVVLNSSGKIVEKTEAAMTVSEILNQLKSLNTSGNRRKTTSATATPSPTRPSPAADPEPKYQPKSNVSDEALYRFFVEKQDTKGYSIQTGVYEDYKSILVESAKMQDKFINKPILVYSAKLENRSVFKLMVGSFESQQAANNFLTTMKSKGVDGIVKNLSSL